MVNEQLVEYAKTKKQIVFIDLEATEKGDLIALGATKGSFKEGIRVGRLDKGFKEYSKTKFKIGPLVEKMTGINNKLLEEEGRPTEQLIREFKVYCGQNFYDSIFVTYGNYDKRILSNSFLKTNKTQAKDYQNILDNIVDFQAIIYEFLKRKNVSGLSLEAMLNHYNIDRYGNAHDPLSDAFDLGHVFKAFYDFNNKSKNEALYIRFILLSNNNPQVINKLVSDILQFGSVNKSALLTYIKEELNK